MTPRQPAADATADKPTPPVPDEEPEAKEPEAKKPATKDPEEKDPPFPLGEKNPTDDVKPGPAKDADPAPKPDDIKIKPFDPFGPLKKPDDGLKLDPPEPGPAALPKADKKPAEIFPPPPGGAARDRTDSVLVAIQVPTRAKVFINGRETASTGTRRHFVSRGLQPGYSYQYEIRAEVNRDGRLVSDTKTLTLRAGEQTRVRFDLAGQQVQPVETTVSIRVPEDAKVFLAGSATRSTGSERTFTTTRLAAGQAWENYTVRVVANVNGQSVTQSRTIKLVGGQDQTLTFQFTEEKVAATTAAGAR